MPSDSGLRRLILTTLLPSFPGQVAPEWALRLVSEGLAGYVLFGYNIAEPAQLSALTATLRDRRPDVLIAIDEEGGDVTRLAHQSGSDYPGNAALGAVDDPVLTEQVYRSIGVDLAAAGINLNLAPSLDVNTSDENPVIGTRSFGADPRTVRDQGAAAVAGLQSVRVAACVKHFPGHGGTATDSHLDLPTVDVPLGVLRDRDLMPFAAAIAAGTRAVMTAHIRVPALTGDLPATFSPAALTDLLRGELGFGGTVVTDALEMWGAAGIAGSTPRAAVLALAAGADLLCVGADVDLELIEACVAAIAAAVASGDLPTGRLEQAAQRVDELVGWAAPSGALAGGSGSAAIGYPAARRAIRVEGVPGNLESVLLVQVEAEENIAVGDVPWGLGPHLNGSEQVRVVAGQADPVEIGARAAGRPIVVVGRNLHRLRGAAALIEALATTHPVVAVEMGWPTSWRPAGVRAFVTTYGASRANAWAAADALGLAA